MGNKHPPPKDQPVDRPDDLEENPGIGQSKGLFGRAGSDAAERLAGENTVEGDIENDSTLGDGAGTRRGRTND